MKGPKSDFPANDTNKQLTEDDLMSERDRQKKNKKKMEDDEDARHQQDNNDEEHDQQEQQQDGGEDDVAKKLSKPSKLQKISLASNIFLPTEEVRQHLQLLWQKEPELTTLLFNAIYKGDPFSKKT